MHDAYLAIAGQDNIVGKRFVWDWSVVQEVRELAHGIIQENSTWVIFAGRCLMGAVNVQGTILEDEVVRRWWSLPSGSLLPLSNGGTYRLLYAGHRGSTVGPDVRDAVFSVMPASAQPGVSICEQRLVGDVEFHVYASSWVQHQHHTDVRYNNVVLHVVLICDDPEPTRCATGAAIPVCSLNDLPTTPNGIAQVDLAGNWPCQQVVAQISTEVRARLLQQAGLLRFEQKAHAFLVQLRSILCPGAACDAYDTCLIPALAEGLGYGRDRDFFRAAGNYLLGLSTALPVPMGSALQPAPLDVQRLRVLARLVTRWRGPGLWQTLRAILLASGDECCDLRLHTLRSLFGEAGLSLARTDILLCNVVLPFALAAALQEHDTLLAMRAQQLYEQHPGLPSNRVTRMMRTQLHLPVEPQGSCQQQGLHYIYQQTCRAKHCAICLMGKMQI
jgi:hypothetical protein